MRRIRFGLASIGLVGALAGAAPGQDAAAAEKVATLLAQAAAAEQAEQFDDAVAVLRAALDLEPRHALANARLGRLLYAQGNTGEGLGLLYRAVEFAPRDAECVIALVDALLSERDGYFAEGDAGNADGAALRAKAFLDAALAGGGAAGKELVLRQVRVLSRLAEHGKEAFTLAMGLVVAHPEDLGMHAALLEATTAGREFEAALAFYADAAMPEWLRAWYGAEVLAARATSNYNRFVDDEAAVADYLEADRRILDAARLNPDVFDSASERASFYRAWAGWTRFTRQKRTEEAWDLFVSALGRDPRNSSALEGLSWIGARLYEEQDLDRARELYRQACTLAPERADFWNNYGLICRDTGQFEESFRAYRRAMVLLPEDARTINDTALILQYHLHRDLDLAERWLIQAEDLARAALAKAIDDADEAGQAEHRAVLGDVLVNLARLFGDQGRLQESAEHWNELRAVSPERPELPENGGEANLPPPPPAPPAKNGGGGG